MIDVPETPQQSRTDEPSASASLPEGAFHLLIADDDLAQPYGGYVAVCGEAMNTSSLPPSCYPEVGPGRDPRYCPACVREAARFSAEVDRASGVVIHTDGLFSVHVR